MALDRDDYQLIVRMQDSLMHIASHLANAEFNANSEALQGEITALRMVNEELQGELSALKGAVSDVSTSLDHVVDSIDGLCVAVRNHR